MWKIAFSNSSPLYKQIIQLIEKLIENGQLSSNERLPSERRLSQLLGVNRSTIIHALNDLTDRGILVRKIGSGTFVNTEKWKKQNYPLIGWSFFRSLFNQEKQDFYNVHIDQLRKQSSPLVDLASGDICQNLLPKQNFSQFSWQHLLSLEQDHETARLGLYSFRKAIQQHLRIHHGLPVDIEEILITTGTQQALFLISHILLKPGDHIGIEASSSFYQLPIFQTAGLRIYPLPMDQEGVTLEGLERLLKKTRINMIFLNPVFQNPTGRIMSQERKKALLSLCYRKKIPMIEDDSCSLLAFNSETDTTPIKCYDHQQQMIYVGSLSKYIGKNIRAGWIIAPRTILHQLADIRQQIDGGLSILPQLLAEHYLLKQMDKHCLFLKEKLRDKAQDLTTWLHKNYAAQLTFQKPQGGLYLYAYLNHGTNQKLLLEDWLSQKITVARGDSFGDKNKTVRLNFSYWSCLKD